MTAEKAMVGTEIRARCAEEVGGSEPKELKGGGGGRGRNPPRESKANATREKKGTSVRKSGRKKGGERAPERKKKRG